MSKATVPILVGRKIGMTRWILDDKMVPVTAIHFTDGYITQVKTSAKDGYSAVQLCMESGAAKLSRVSKALAGHYAAAKVKPGKHLCEGRISEEEVEEFNLGDEVSVAAFENVKWVDVTGTSIGKGFAGTVKRHGFSMQDATHGNSKAHRALGSTGQNQSPGRVFKGKKMPGHMGHVKRTMQSLEVMKVDVENGYLLVKGSVPGPKNGVVVVCEAKKKES